jgi:hypothetical protein
MDEGKFTVVSRRLYIMMIALIAPELTITWATMQFLTASDTAKAFNDAFGAQLHQTLSDHPDMEESATTLLNEFRQPTPDGKNSLHLSAPHVAGRNFRGRLSALYFGAVTNFIQWIPHRMDYNTWFFRVDGWIHALRQ